MTDEHASWNLLYRNTNPNPATICGDCAQFIGHVFRPGEAPPVPMHPNCYCVLTPTKAPPTWPPVEHPGRPEQPDTWESFFARLKRVNPAAFRRWVQRAAWYLRRTWDLGIILPLRPLAEEHNRRREEEREGEEDSAMTAPNPATPPQAHETVPAPEEAPNDCQRVRVGPVPVELTALSLASRRREYDAILVQAGWIRHADGSDSEWLIPAEVLQDAADRGLFSPVSHYVDHPDKFGLGWPQTPSVRDLGGVVINARWDPELNAVRGTLRLYDTEAGHFMALLYDQILADRDAEQPVPPIGLSIAAFRKFRLDRESGNKIWTEIRKVDSVDLVYEPGAAGYVRQALACAAKPASEGKPRATRAPLRPADPPPYRPKLEPGADPPTPTGGRLMTEEHTLAEDGSAAEHGSAEEPTPPEIPFEAAPAGPAERSSLAESSSAASPKPPAPEDRSRHTDDTIARIQDNVDALHGIVGHLSSVVSRDAERSTIQGMGDPPRTPGYLYGGRDSLDRVRLAAEALLASTRPPDGIRPLTGIRELYMLLSGDYELTGRFNSDRVYLANVNTSTMSNIVADVLNKRVINMFQSYDQWWQPGVTVQDFTTLQDIKWITLGGVSELPTVAEGAAYTEMTWDDQRETTSFIKKGGYLGITLETIDKDDTGRVMAAPRALAQAAWMTLGKSIANVFTSNAGVGPTMSDSDSLFDNNHSNLGSTALSFTAWQATKIAMMKQTELNSGERLGALTRPRLLWVPIDLEDTAIEILAAGEGHIGTADYRVNPDAAAESLRARIQAARTRVITVPFWTDTTNWAAQADPTLYPSIGLGFRYGRTPEIFSVADPRAGLMFTNDTMPVKVRFFYAVGPTDWRGLYKHNV